MEEAPLADFGPADAAAHWGEPVVLDQGPLPKGPRWAVQALGKARLLSGRALPFHRGSPLRWTGPARRQSPRRSWCRPWGRTWALAAAESPDATPPEMVGVGEIAPRAPTATWCGRRAHVVPARRRRSRRRLRRTQRTMGRADRGGGRCRGSRACVATAEPGTAGGSPRGGLTGDGPGCRCAGGFGPHGVQRRPPRRRRGCRGDRPRPADDGGHGRRVSRGVAPADAGGMQRHDAARAKSE